jgi:DNA-binding MarR family transcriptional regulator
MNSEEHEELGELLLAFMDRVSHSQGTVLTLLTEMSITVQQVVVLDRIRSIPNCTPSELASEMRVSPPSISQMIDRLGKRKLVRRIEDGKDRRCKVLGLTPKARSFLLRLHRARLGELVQGTSCLSFASHNALRKALLDALEDVRSESRSLKREPCK